MYRAVNQFGLGRKVQALEELGAVFESNPEYEYAGATLVILRLKERRYDEAVVAARSLLQGNPDNHRFAVSCAALHLVKFAKCEAKCTSLPCHCRCRCNLGRGRDHLKAAI